jgi:hypothetical protein
MDIYINQKDTVISINTTGVGMSIHEENKFEKKYRFPAQYLKLIEKKPTPAIVKLNENYKAEIYKDKVVVGCQEFPISVIDKLVIAHNKTIKS